MAVLRVGVLTVSDGCAQGTRDDVSGGRIVDFCDREGHDVVERAVVPDESDAISGTLLSWCEGGGVDVILTTGGTGFGPRDRTPEATAPLLDRDAPGIAEAIRRKGVESTPYASLSRGRTGSRGRTFIANLPGSPSGVDDGLQVLAPLLGHICGLLAGGRPSHDPSEA